MAPRRNSRTPQVSSLGRYRDERGAVKTPKPKRSGRAFIHVRGRSYSLPRVMCWAFDGPPPKRATRRSEMYDADHIDGDRTNNTKANLRWLLTSLNIGRVSRNPVTTAKRVASRSRPVLARQVGVHNAPWVQHDGTQQAARTLKLPRGSISKIANGKRKTLTSKKTGLTWEFKWADQVERVAADEEWRDVVVPDRRVWTESEPARLIVPKCRRGQPPQISSYGRVRNSGGIRMPVPRSSGYSSVSVSHKTYLIHRLVYFAFKGLPPTSKHVVDHKEEVYAAGNHPNRASNLQAITQAKNNAKVINRASCGPQQLKPVRGRKPGETEWSVQWNSSAECAAALSRSTGNVSDAIAKGRICNGYKLEYIPTPDLPGEVWKDIPEAMYAEEERLAALR